MVERVSVHGLQVARELHDFVTRQALPGTGVEPEKFWSGFAALAAALMPVKARNWRRLGSGQQSGVEQESSGFMRGPRGG